MILNNRQKESLQHILYWHHAKPYRQNDDFTGVYKAYEYLIKNIQADQFEILIQRTSDLVKRINNLSKNYYANESIEKHIDWNIDQAQELKDNFEYQFKSKYFSIL